MVGGQNGLSVATGIAVDVGDGFVHARHHFHADNGSQVFLAPIGFGGGLEQCGRSHGRQQAQRFGATAHFHTLARKHHPHARQKVGGHATRHQQALSRVTRAVFLRFSVVGHFHGHVDIARIVHIGVAVAIQVLDDGHLGLAADALNQALATARDDDIHVSGHGDELAHGLAVGGGHQLHRLGGQACLHQCLLHQRGQSAVAVDGLGATTQDASVAALDAQGRGFDGDVGTALVDHAKHANRHPHLADTDAAGLLLHADDFTNDVGHGRELFTAFCTGFNHFGAKFETVDHRFAQASGAGTFQIFGVLGLQRVHVGAQQGGQRTQGAHFGGRTRLGHQGAGGLGLLAQGLHQFNGRRGAHGSISIQKKRAAWPCMWLNGWHCAAVAAHRWLPRRCGRPQSRAHGTGLRAGARPASVGPSPTRWNGYTG